MHPRLQAKLLRAVQEREIDRVGGTQPIKVNVRLLATSNRNLDEAVKNGDFREDLFFRLNVVSIRLPALRERPLDIDLLARHFVEVYSESTDVPQRPLSDPTRELLRRHPCRGNVRDRKSTRLNSSH